LKGKDYEDVLRTAEEDLDQKKKKIGTCNYEEDDPGEFKKTRRLKDRVTLRVGRFQGGREGKGEVFSWVKKRKVLVHVNYQVDVADYC